MTIPVEHPTGTELVRVRTCMYSITEFRLFFRLTGLEMIAAYGEDLNELTDKSKRMILMGRKVEKVNRNGSKGSA